MHSNDESYLRITSEDFILATVVANHVNDVHDVGQRGRRRSVVVYED